MLRWMLEWRRARVGHANVGLFGKEQRHLKLLKIKVFVPYRDLNPLNSQAILDEPVPDVLRQLVHHKPDFIVGFQVPNTSDAMANRLDRRDEIRRHDLGVVRAIGKAPEHDAILSQLAAQHFRITPGKIANRVDIDTLELPRSRWPDIEQI